MTVYLVHHSGDGTDNGAANTLNPDATAWSKAEATLTAALALATANGDVILIDKDHTGDNVVATTTYTFGANISLICVDKDASNVLAVMGSAAWIGAAATAITIDLTASARRVYCYGITLRNGSSSGSLQPRLSGDGMHFVMDNCYFWMGNAHATTQLLVGSQDANGFAKFINCTFRAGATSQNVIRASAKVVIEGGSISADGSVPTSLLSFVTTDPGGGSADVIGFDASFLGSGALVNDSTAMAATVRFSQCKLGSGYVAIAAQTHLNRSSIDVYINDCSSGDTHGLIAHHNPMGSTVSDTGIYFTTGAAAQSWKIVTTANCSYYTPYESPWLGYYNTGTSAITPYLEILRDGSATAYQDDEVWGEWAAKVTTGSTQATLYSDRMALLGTPANQAAGAGLGSWTGETTTGAPDAWSGKLAPGSSFTPAENGHIQARVCVGEPSITVYVDPQIRT